MREWSSIDKEARQVDNRRMTHLIYSRASLAVVDTLGIRRDNEEARTWNSGCLYRCVICTLDRTRN